VKNCTLVATFLAGEWNILLSLTFYIDIIVCFGIAVNRWLGGLMEILIEF
jgi:hypothetical protein